MKFAGRMNSFVFQGKDLFQTIDRYKQMEGITHLEFNFPEHVVNYDMDELRRRIAPMKVNGVATRFRSHFVAGEFTNPDSQLRREAVQLCKDAADACRALDAQVLTVWLGYDGFDYAFQVDYEKQWNAIIESFREIADYAKDIKISIEYKPYEPRVFSMIDGIGLTLLAIEEIDRPNVGVTLDFCHMLMKHESPAYSLALAARKNKLFGLHVNDGYRRTDDGLIFGSVNLAQSLEFVYYLKKYRYDGVVFFDTFPLREDAATEINANIRSFKQLSDMVDRCGMERIEKIVSEQNGVSAHCMILELLQGNVAL